MNTKDFSPQSVALFWAKVDVRGPDDCLEWRAQKTKGYGRVRINTKNYGAHRVALVLSVGAVDPDLVVRHLCHNTTCCNPRHLAVGTHGDNRHDSSKAGRLPHGEGHHKNKLTESQVIEIRKLLASGTTTHREICGQYGIARGTVSAIAKNKIWKHLLNEDSPITSGIKDRRLNRAKITKDQALEIFFLSQEGGRRVGDIARQYGLSANHVQDIKMGRRWGSITGANLC